jgi:hypothetical protein
MTDETALTPEGQPSGRRRTPHPEAAARKSTRSLRHFFVWLSNQSKQTIVAAIIAGLVSLGITLINDQVESQNFANQSHSEYQIQAMQSLQNSATIQFNNALAIYHFQTACVGHLNTWRSCAGEAPQFNAFFDGISVFDTAANNVADHEAQQLALLFDTLCTQMFGSASADHGSELMNQVIDTYLNLNKHLGQLIQKS